VQELDGPPFIGNYYLHRAVHRAARADSVRVVLDGSGGDDAVSYGTALLAELANAGRWGQLYEELTALSQRTGVPPDRLFGSGLRAGLRLRAQRHPIRFLTRDVLRLRRDYGTRTWGLIKRHLIKPRLPNLVRIVWQKLWRQRHESSSTSPLLNPEFAKRINYAQRARTLRANRQWDSRLDARRLHWATLHYGAGVTSAGLEEMDILAAHQGIERRHPFFDVRLLEYCVAIPPEQKLHKGWSRYILRRALHNILPMSIRERVDKADLSLNFNRNTLKFERDRIDTLVDLANHSFRSFVDITTLRQAQANGKASPLWHAVALNEWLRQLERL
jgi:asparagine synthase (glutamine-hydrolysing)